MPLPDARSATGSSDVVAVFNGQFQQVFSLARPVRARVTDSSKAMEHPVENGTTVTDFVIDMPIEVELSMILSSGEYRATFQTIKQLKAQRQLLTVQTKAATYFNMLITDIPHDEDADLFDALAVSVKLKEVRIVEAQFARLPAKKVVKKVNASTVKKGQQQPQPTTPATAPKGSILSRVFS